VAWVVGGRWPAAGWERAASSCTSRLARGAFCLGADTELAIWVISLYASCDGLGPGCNGCGNSAYATSNKLGPAVDGAKSAVAAALWGTRRPLRLAQLMEGAEVSGALVAEMAKARTHAVT
jgi:hypothetical protein